MNIRLTTYCSSDNIPSLPGKNVFHSTAFFHVLERTPGYQPMLIVAFSGASPVAKLLCVNRPSNIHILQMRRCVVYGEGEYFGLDEKEKNQVFELMFSHLVFQQQGKTFFIEVRNLSYTLFGYRIFREHNFFPVKWLRIRNSIHKEKFDKWMDVTRRRQLEYGQKSGATMEVVRNEADVITLANLLKRYYSSKVRQYFPDVRFFIQVYREIVSEGMGDIFVVRYKGKIIGGAVCFYDEEKAYLLFSGGLNKTYYAQYPGALAVWKAMLRAKEIGKLHFEFINVGLPFKKYGFRNFLLRFGGQQSSIRRWYRCKWRWLNQLLTYIYV